VRILATAFGLFGLVACKTGQNDFGQCLAQAVFSD
jgi:hypothetical protein